MRGGVAVARLVAAMALTLLGAACLVPDLASLGPKACDLDAGIGCAQGYYCAGGVCLQGPGECTGSETRACGRDAGRCRPGTQRCAGALWGACEGAIEPTVEICNGIDDDCNGRVDDNVVDAPPCPLQKGVCQGAHAACVDAGFRPTCLKEDYGASYEPIETSCDGKDNDCDGVADESVTGGACADAGVCVGHDRTCVAGAPGGCAAPGWEAIEQSCDGLDNDCDGLIDEGLVSSTRTCALNVGVCAGRRPACVDGGYEPACTAASYGSGYESAETRCDGLDNDCDGIIDRLPDGGFLRSGPCEYALGVCAGALRVCAAGAFEATCTGVSYGPGFQASETACDGLDNDCDGQIDRSRASVLGSVAGTSAASAAACGATSQGVLCALVGVAGAGAAVSVVPFSTALKAAGAPRLLSDPAASSARLPAMATGPGDRVAVAWEERVGAGVRVQVSRLGADGGTEWTQSVAPEASLGGPRVTWLGSPERVVVAWIELSSRLVHGATFDGAGTRLVGPLALTAGLDGGGELSTSVDLAGADGGLLLGWIGSTLTEQRVSLRALGGDLSAAQPPRTVAVAGESAFDVRVWAAPSGPAAAWLTTGGAAPSIVRWWPSAFAADSGVQLVVARPGTASGLVRAGDGFLAWSENGSVYSAPGRADAGVQLVSTGSAACGSPGAFARDTGATTLVFTCDGGVVEAVTACAP